MSITTLFFLATAFLAICTGLPMWRHSAWWVRSLDFPRLQFFVISLALVLSACLLLDLSRPTAGGLLLICLACMLYHLWWIVPYTRLAKVEVPPTVQSNPKRTIRILTANVLTPNRNAKALIGLVREHAPHVLVTLESDAWWQTRLDELAPDYPHTIKCPLDNLYGMHVYSRYPLSESRIDYLVDPEVPSMHALVDLPSGEQIRVHFLHPAPPSPTENDTSAERDAELIIVARSVADTDSPVIVTGDLNDVAWSETTRLFRKISGLLDPRVGRGMFNTFHANHWFMRWPLDHLFHSSHFTLSHICRLPGFGSDHFALLTELVYAPQHASRSAGLDAAEEDITRAKAKAADQGVGKEDVPQPDSSDSTLATRPSLPRPV